MKSYLKLSQHVKYLSLIATAFSTQVLAIPIDINLDREITRTRLGTTEGLSSFNHANPTFNGNERTGWTDIRHPYL